MKMNFEIKHGEGAEAFVLDIDPTRTSIGYGFITVVSADGSKHWTWALENVKSMTAEEK